MGASHVFFLLIMLYMSNSFKLSYSLGKNIIVVCPNIEREALSVFKQSLEDPSDRLSSWNISGEANCCKWRGVVCSNVTGHVARLHLRGDFGYSDSLKGKINPSLSNLKQLEYLDLSQNDFEETIPSFIGSLTKLEYLNLSNAGFHGRIPHNMGNLSNLRSLSFDGNERSFYNDEYYKRKLDVDGIEWLSRLPQLVHLNMNYVNLNKARNWLEVINTLPSLAELHLSSCGLDFMPTLSHVNLTSLAILDLSGNVFDSFALPSWIFQQSNLIFLDLGEAQLEGPIPTSSNITKLQYIDLSDNNLHSSIPNWLYICKDLEYISMRNNFLRNTISDAITNLTSLSILDLGYNELSGKILRGIGNLCKMRELDLSSNMLQGEISDSFGNMSDCFLSNLASLSLSNNQISGNLTHQFGEFTTLETLDLGTNVITGAIPINLGNLSQVRTLRLGDNKLSGDLPMSIGQLSNLSDLGIGNNMLQGIVTENHFANLTKLDYFSASANHLTLIVSRNWIPPFGRLSTLKLGSWDLGTNIPSWLSTQKGLMELDLSNTGISGYVPTWFWDVRFLNISYNHFYGSIPDITGLEEDSGPRLMYLRSNQFNGSLPRVGNAVTEIDLSDNLFSGGISHFLCDMRNQTYRLENLHLGGNQLFGEIPDCFNKWPLLTVLNLGNNNFSGSIPNSLGFLQELLSLNLYGNHLSRQIPSSIRNCTQLVMMDISRNQIVGNIPTWIGPSLAKLRFLILQSNNLSGVIPSTICHLNALQILDLSDNAISGVIPKCVGNFTAMATKRNLSEYVSGDLDYSSYYFGAFLESASVDMKGREYRYDTTLSLVTNVDISNNNLSGDIPEELMSLVELRSLNLSGNHFTGLIPKNTGDMKQLESLDLSRNSLSGEIPISFGVLSSLNYLNLSYNNLSGKIPESTQISGMSALSFIGNNLCGFPLTSCSSGDDEVGQRRGYEEDNEEDDEYFKTEWFYAFLSLGYAMGISVFFTTLVLKRSWRDAYFGLLERIWNKVYVYFHIKWKKDSRF